MEDTLLFDGVRYVSSNRAAKLVGYTKDYVGQLCRGGKLEARFVGRSWYVSEDGIRRHKLDVHYTRHQPVDQRMNVLADTTSIKRDTTHLVERREEAAPVRDSEKAQVVEIRRSKAARTALDVRHADELKDRQYRTLSQSDVRFEEGEPLFFEDDRPVLPTPEKVTRFEGVPIVARSAARTLSRSAPPTGSVERPATGSVRVRRIVPDRRPRSGISMDGVSLTQERNADVHRQMKPLYEAPRSRVSGRSYDEPTSAIRQRPTSKAFPLLGAFVVVALSFLAWLIAVGIGVDIPTLL